LSRPVVEVLVEGELSPFEHEALYKLLKKHFRLEQPVYSELLDETIGTVSTSHFIAEGRDELRFELGDCYAGIFSCSFSCE
jgi:hypothetical protein